MAESKYVTYDLKNQIATITMNDGGKNLMSPQMLHELNRALDQAEKDKAVVIITGAGNTFSAGFDLRVLKKGTNKALKMLNDGFALTTRLLSFSTPIVIACNGHAVAMGVFILLSGDYTIGLEGSFKFVANEVAIGMTMPATIIHVCRNRLTPAHFGRVVNLAEVYTPSTAIEAGFLDSTVSSKEALMEKAIAKATEYTKLSLDAHYKTKRRSRKHLIRKLKRANLYDRIDVIRQAVNGMLKKK